MKYTMPLPIELEAREWRLAGIETDLGRPCSLKRLFELCERKFDTLKEIAEIRVEMAKRREMA